MADKYKPIEQLLKGYATRIPETLKDRLSIEDVKTAKSQYESLRGDYETLKKNPHTAHVRMLTIMMFLLNTKRLSTVFSID